MRIHPFVLLGALVLGTASCGPGEDGIWRGYGEQWGWVTRAWTQVELPTARQARWHRHTEARPMTPVAVLSSGDVRFAGHDFRLSTGDSVEQDADARELADAMAAVRDTPGFVLHADKMAGWALAATVFSDALRGRDAPLLVRWMVDHPDREPWMTQGATVSRATGADAATRIILSPGADRETEAHVRVGPGTAPENPTAVETSASWRRAAADLQGGHADALAVEIREPVAWADVVHLFDLALDAGISVVEFPASGLHLELEPNEETPPQHPVPDWSTGTLVGVLLAIVLAFAITWMPLKGMRRRRP